MSYNPFEAPEATDVHASDASPTGVSNLADRGTRFAGAFIDGILMTVISFGSQYASGTLAKVTSGIPVIAGDQLLQSLIGVVAFLLLHGYLLLNHGQTIGKRLVGTRIVDAQTGQLLPFTRVYVIRYLWMTPLAIAVGLSVAYVPPGLVALLSALVGGINLLDSSLIFGKQKRCLHDYLAGSIVVNVRR